jgi:hypothetical protein
VCIEYVCLPSRRCSSHYRSAQVRCATLLQVYAHPRRTLAPAPLASYFASSACVAGRLRELACMCQAGAGEGQGEGAVLLPTRSSRHVTACLSVVIFHERHMNPPLRFWNKRRLATWLRGGRVRRGAAVVLLLRKVLVLANWCWADPRAFRAPLISPAAHTMAHTHSRARARHVTPL